MHSVFNFFVNIIGHPREKVVILICNIVKISEINNMASLLFFVYILIKELLLTKV